MRTLRVLLTNNTLAARAGSELYVRDVATALLRLGHRPVAYSRSLGPVAEELRLATVPVVDDLDRLGDSPDIIHGHHNLETMAALLRFPSTPAVFFCHGWLPWEEAPPPAPRILRYVAVDDACRDRLVFEHAIPPDRVCLLPNFVDLDRFKPRGPLPARPSRALVFSNYATERTSLPAIRAACAAEGIEVDVAGIGCGRVLDRPEDVLGEYDLVFAKARAALEAMAVGAGVIVCDWAGLGGFVSPERFAEWRGLNFGIRCLRHRLASESIRREIRAYDPAAAAGVSRRVRSEAGLDTAMQRIVGVYGQALEEWRSHPVARLEAEGAAAAAYLRQLEPRVKGHDRVWAEREAALSERDSLARRVAQLEEERRVSEIESASLRSTVRALETETQAQRAAHASAREETARQIDVLRALEIQRAVQASTLKELSEALDAEKGHRSVLEVEHEAVRRERTALRAELDAIHQLWTYRLRTRLLRSRRLASLYRSVSGRRPPAAD